jgi:CheY-like chemotaxis protein
MRDGTPASVLVVEDDPGIRALMLAVVRRGGFEAETVANGVDAIAMLARRRFATIILDLLLPRSSGYDVLEWIEASAPDVLPNVIILSATSPSIVRKHSVTRRVFRVMQKPFDIEELLETLCACASQGEGDDPFLAVRLKSNEAHADAAIVGVVGRERDKLHLVWSFGYDPAIVAKHSPMPLSNQMPLGTAVVEARPVWIRTRSEIATAYPELEPLLQRRTRALAAVPIVDSGRVAGSIGFSFGEEQLFDDGQQELLQAIAAHCAPFAKTDAG